MNRMTSRTSLALCAVVVSLVAGCNVPPREAFQEYVARDAWDTTCAEQAIVEKWAATNGHWKIDGEVWVVDVDATFKMANECTSGLPVVGQSYKQFQAIPFKKSVEMSKCKDTHGTTGWAVPDREGSRCWTGPNLVK